VFQGWTSFKPWNDLLHSFCSNLIPFCWNERKKEKREKCVRVFILSFFVEEEGETKKKRRNWIPQT
jgi:hypothetical protein